MFNKTFNFFVLQKDMRAWTNGIPLFQFLQDVRLRLPESVFDGYDDTSHQPNILTYSYDLTTYFSGSDECCGQGSKTKPQKTILEIVSSYR